MPDDDLIKQAMEMVDKDSENDKILILENAKKDFKSNPTKHNALMLSIASSLNTPNNKFLTKEGSIDLKPKDNSAVEKLVQYLNKGKEDSKTNIKNNFWYFINPKIKEVAYSRFQSGHFADSVEAAMKEVNNTVKKIYHDKTGKENDGSSLMNEAFSPKNPLIILEDQTNQSGRDAQLGYMQIFSGSMTGIRNPKAHDNVTITSDRAIHLIFLASLLMYKIDETIKS